MIMDDNMVTKLMKWLPSTVIQNTCKKWSIIPHTHSEFKVYSHDSFSYRTTRRMLPVPAVKAPANHFSWWWNFIKHHSQTTHVWKLVHGWQFIQREHILLAS